MPSSPVLAARFGPSSHSAVVYSSGRVQVSGAPLEMFAPGGALVSLVRATIAADVDSVRFLWTQEGVRSIARVEIDVPANREFGHVTVERLANAPYHLTVREIDVLTMLVAGLSNQQIAVRLVASTRTITTHVDRVLTKMGVANRTAAAVTAHSEGIVRLPLPGGSYGFENVEYGRIDSVFRGDRIPARRLSPKRRPLLIGAVLPLRGDAADDGNEMLRGSELAVAELNTRGGIHGRQLELVVAEVDVTPHNGADVASAFESLAAQSVDALTSGYLGTQDVAHEMAAQLGSPYLNAATSQAMVDRVSEEPRFNRIFQVVPSEVHYGPGFLRFLTHLRDSRQWRPSSREVLILEPADSAAIDFGSEAMAEIADRRGWQLSTLRASHNTEAGWSGIADEVRRRAPAAAFIGHYYVPGTVAFLRAVLDDPPPTLLYALYSPSIPAFRRSLGAAAEGLLWATVSGTYSDERGRSFADRYRTTYGAAPGRAHAGTAYDRVHIIASAWSRSSNPHDFAQVAGNIRSTTYRGVNGAYHLDLPGQSALAYPDSTRDPSIAQAHLVYQVQGGRHRILAPEPYADSSFVLPPWIAGRR